MICVRKHLAFMLSVLLMLASGMFSCTQEQKGKEAEKAVSEKASEPSRLSALMKEMNIYQFKDPNKAPDFELESVSGEMISLRQYRGKVVMLSFWATW